MVTTSKLSSYVQSIDSIGDGLFSYTPHFCIVPEALYREEDNDLWLNFLEEHINREQIVCATYMEEDKCFVLHEKESDGKEEHCISFLMRKSHSLNSTSKVLVMHCGTVMCLVMYKDNTLQLANVYPIRNIEDVLYYLLNVCEQISADRQIPIYITNHELATNTLLSTYLNIHYLSLEQ